MGADHANSGSTVGLTPLGRNPLNPVRELADWAAAAVVE